MESSETSAVRTSDEQLQNPIKMETEDDEYLYGETSGSLDPTGGQQEYKGFLNNVVKMEKPDDEDDDGFLYCEECRGFFINKCEVHGAPIFIPDTPVPLGVPDRAKRSLPPGLELQKSSVPAAGMGVVNKGAVLPVGVHFGPYQGDLVDKEQAMSSSYSWVVYKSGQSDVYVDASIETHANWMRYVKCACNDEEYNLLAFQYQGGIMYRCCRPIAPGQELLVWYDEVYAKHLGGAFNDFWTNKCSNKELNSFMSQVFVCVLCPLSYKSAYQLNCHIKRSHYSQYMRLQKPQAPSSHPNNESCANQSVHPAEKPYPCSVCGKTFTRPSDLQSHNRTHTGEKPYNCSLCGKSFAQKCALKAHHLTHTGEKPYPCLSCGKSFGSAGTLAAHQRIHTGEKPYHCSQCGKSFRQKSDLSIHQRIHTKEKPYPCSLCEKTFHRPSDLQRHQRIHTGEKPYHCSECGKSFAHKCALKSHHLTHTGKKPYHCLECGKSFGSKGNLTAHQLIHTGERPYNCPQCGQCFRRKGNLQKHQNTHTSEDPFHCAQYEEGFGDIIPP